jgi:hypothetical protein
MYRKYSRNFKVRTKVMNAVTNEIILSAKSFKSFSYMMTSNKSIRYASSHKRIMMIK